MNQDLLELLALKEELDALYKSSFPSFLVNEVMTVDESANVTGADSRVMRWPTKEEQLYLWELAHIIPNERALMLPKSRRMMISWILSAYCVWVARYQSNAAVFWMSEVEKKAAYAVDQRMVFIENNLRNKVLRRNFETTKTKDSLVGHIRYIDTKSYILALAARADTLRSYTGTVIILDECEFIDQIAGVMRSAKPLAENGAQLILCSSSNGPVGPIAEACKEVGFTSYNDMPKLLLKAS